MVTGIKEQHKEVSRSRHLVFNDVLLMNSEWALNENHSLFIDSTFDVVFTK